MLLTSGWGLQKVRNGWLENKIPAPPLGTAAVHREVLDVESFAKQEPISHILLFFFFVNSVYRFALLEQKTNT